MSVKSGLRTYLAAQSTITAIVGSSPVRIYPVVLPQGAARPAVTYRRMSGAHAHVLSGSAGRAAPRFRLDCWADSYEEADTLAEAIRQKMQGFTGLFGSTTVTAVTLADDFDDWEPPIDASDNGIYHVTLDYMIQYRESVPSF